MPEPPPIDPDELLRGLQEDAGSPPMAPLRLAPPAASDRPGPVARAVEGARRLVLRLVTPTLADLLSQLERDRHRLNAELRRAHARIDELQRRMPPGAPPDGG